MRKIIIFTICCIASIHAFAQSEAANWYFGYGGGLKFNQASGTISSLNDGQLFTNEGCASISDDSGNLLFYTDGTRVWNKNHAIMNNGNGLYGDSSSTQSAIIVPKPDSQNIYYIFTVDNGLDGFDFGLNYSIVDISLDGGLGRVTNKNSNLLPQSSEKITAVLKDCITKSIWLLTFASENGNSLFYNTFHAFEVSNTGVSNTSVKSTFPLNIGDARGYLKLSPDGTKIAHANVRDGLYIYDFDVATGTVSNQIDLFINGPNNKPYGVEFSPNSQLLYVHSSNDFFDRENPNNNNKPVNHSSSLIQYNLLSPDIENSAVIIDDRQLYRGGLQLGPNGKIYRALSATYNLGLPYLGVINDPNVIGSGCNYQHNAINLSPNDSSQGLPPFITSFFNTQIDIIKNGESTTNLPLCENDTYTLVAEELAGATYTWTRDGNLLSEIDFDLEVTQSGHYQVYIDPNNGDCAIEGEAFVIFNPNPEAMNSTLIQCDEDGIKDGLTLFNLTEANEALTNMAIGHSVKFYRDVTRTDEILNTNNFYNTTNPQIIYTEVIDNSTDCFSYSELTLNVSVTNSEDTELIACDDDGNEDGFYNFNLNDANNDLVFGLPLGLEITYFETYEDALTEQNILENSFTNTIAYSQTIFGRVENANNCYGISEVLLTVKELPNINIEDVFYYCLNTFPQTVPINAAVLNDTPNNYSFSWSSGETSYEIQINNLGIYNVTVTNANGCSKNRTVTIEPSNIATFQSINVVDASQNNIVTVLVAGEGTYEYALYKNNNVYRDFQASNTFENVFPGIYTIQVKDIKNDCGTVSNDVSVIGFPKFFTPNNDGQHDTWQVYGISNMFQPNSKILIYNRYGKLLKQLDPLGRGWDGSLNGEKLPTDDYWFAVTLQDGRIFKSHFTLKK